MSFTFPLTATCALCRWFNLLSSSQVNLRTPGSLCTALALPRTSSPSPGILVYTSCRLNVLVSLRRTPKKKLNVPLTMSRDSTKLAGRGSQTVLRAADQRPCDFSCVFFASPDVKRLVRGRNIRRRPSTKHNFTTDTSQTTKITINFISCSQHHHHYRPLRLPALVELEVLE